MSLTKKIVVSRAINGISLNGSEYLLDENDDVMKFDDVESAKNFLKNHGITDFEEVEFETIGDDD